MAPGSSKKRILMVLHFFPYPPHSGATTRVWNLIQRIAASYAVTLICVTNEAISGADRAIMQRYCQTVHLIRPGGYRGKVIQLTSRDGWKRVGELIGLLLRGVPLGMARVRHSRVGREIESVLAGAEFDLIQIEFVEMGIYLADIRKAVPSGKTVLTEHDISTVQKHRRMLHAPWYLKPLFTVDSILRREYEVRTLLRFDHVITMSPTDSATLVDYGVPAARLSVVPNGADIEGCRPSSRRRHTKELVFLGPMTFFANRDGFVWFVESVLPSVEARHPGVRLVVVGQTDQAICSRYARAGITYRGVVEDLSTEMTNGAVFIAPLRIGSGTRLKILTAMAFGMPVVTTSVGVEGITAGEGNGVVIADSEAGFADAIAGLFADPSKHSDYGRRAREFVEKNCGWASVAETQMLEYERILALV